VLQIKLHGGRVEAGQLGLDLLVGTCTSTRAIEMS
jgi:hypothetical protein